MTRNKSDIRRRWQACILLAVYVPMLIVSVFHVHTPAKGGVADGREPMVCAAQHGDLTNAHQGDCPLCAFLYGGYLLPTVIHAEDPICYDSEAKEIFPYYFIFQHEAVQRHAPRAPPVGCLFF